MLRNFLLIARRNLIKNKGYSFLNIAGLAAGMTCFIFISSWVKDELSYDQGNKKAGRIVRVTEKITTASETFEVANSCVPLARALKDEFGEVENTVRMDKNGAYVKYGNRKFDESGILLTDPSFFDVFDYSLQKGDVKTALKEPYSIILTAAMAKKYFGNEDPLGKTLTVFPI